MCSAMSASATGVVSTAGGVIGLTLSTFKRGATWVLAFSSASLASSVVCGVAADGDREIAAEGADSEAAARDSDAARAASGTIACRYQHRRRFTGSTR